MTKVNTGRVGVAVRGTSGTGVLCWPHANALKGQDGLVLFRIKQTGKPCNLCTQLREAK